MKLQATSLLAGASPLLFLSGTAHAGFNGLMVVAKTVPPGTPGVAGALVCNVFATFDRPGQDRFLAAAGTPDSPMDVHVVGGGFYQHFLGGDTPPSIALILPFPSLAFDSFVTIGLKYHVISDQPTDNLVLSPGWPGFGASSLGGNNLSWSVTPGDAQSDPFNPTFHLGNGQLLIGQFTTLNGIGIVGMFRVLVISNNVSTQLDVSFSHFVPAPGVLALLAIAGGTRRRRRL